MAGLFGGLQAQAAALPPIQRQAAPASRRRGLFGGGQPNPDEIGLMERLSLIGRAGQGEGSYQQLRRAREAEIQAAQQSAAARQVEDRLRAQLSPADGPNGSGTGAAPTAEQQMSAINDARLLNPGVADQFAPAVMVQQRNQQAQTLFANDPRAQALWASGNQSFADSLGEQYKPQVIGAGGRQSVYGEGRTVDAPSFQTVNDTVVRNDPGQGTTTPTFTAPPAYNDVTQRQLGQGNLGVAQGRLALDDRNSGFTLGQNQTRFGPDGQPIANVAPPQASNQAQATSALNAIGNTREAITRARGQTGFWTTGPLAALPLNTPARDLNATLDTVKANLSFNELAQMRANSPTGGALGSIAVRELDLLGSTVASLDQSQSKEELERSLAIIETSLNRWEQAVQAGQTAQAPQGSSAGGQVYENPQTGQRIRWNGSAWVPAQ